MLEMAVANVAIIVGNFARVNARLTHPGCVNGLEARMVAIVRIHRQVILDRLNSVYRSNKLGNC